MPVMHSSQPIKATFCCVRTPFESMVTTLKPTRLVSAVVDQKTVAEPLPSMLVKLMVMFCTFCTQSAGVWSGVGAVGQWLKSSPVWSQTVSVWSGFGTVGQLSQTSPTLSPSASAWLVLATVGQLSQASPTWSPSTSDWLGFGVSGQLSMVSGTPSPSRSATPTMMWFDTAPPAAPPATRPRARYVQFTPVASKLTWTDPEFADAGKAPTGAPQAAAWLVIGWAEQGPVMA